MGNVCVCVCVCVSQSVSKTHSPQTLLMQLKMLKRGCLNVEISIWIFYVTIIFSFPSRGHWQILFSSVKEDTHLIWWYANLASLHVPADYPFDIDKMLLFVETSVNPCLFNCCCLTKAECSHTPHVTSWGKTDTRSWTNPYQCVFVAANKNKQTSYTKTWDQHSLLVSGNSSCWSCDVQSLIYIYIYIYVDDIVTLKRFRANQIVLH